MTGLGPPSRRLSVSRQSMAPTQGLGIQDHPPKAYVVLRARTPQEVTEFAQEDDAWQLGSVPNVLHDVARGVTMDFTHVFAGSDPSRDVFDRLIQPGLQALFNNPGDPSDPANRPLTNHVLLTGHSGAGKSTLFGNLTTLLSEELFILKTATNMDGEAYFIIKVLEDRPEDRGGLAATTNSALFDVGSTYKNPKQTLKPLVKPVSYDYHLELPDSSIVHSVVDSPNKMRYVLSHAVRARKTNSTVSNSASSRGHLHVMISVAFGTPPTTGDKLKVVKADDLPQCKNTLIITDSCGTEVAGARSFPNLSAMHYKTYFKKVDSLTSTGSNLGREMRHASRGSGLTEFVHSTLVQGGHLINIICVAPCLKDSVRARDCLTNGVGLSHIPATKLPPGSHLHIIAMSRDPPSATEQAAVNRAASRPSSANSFYSVDAAVAPPRRMSVSRRASVAAPFAGHFAKSLSAPLGSASTQLSAPRDTTASERSIEQSPTSPADTVNQASSAIPTTKTSSNPIVLASVSPAGTRVPPSLPSVAFDPKLADILTALGAVQGEVANGHSALADRASALEGKIDYLLRNVTVQHEKIQHITQVVGEFSQGQQQIANQLESIHSLIQARLPSTAVRFDTPIGHSFAGPSHNSYPYGTPAPRGQMPPRGPMHTPSNWSTESSGISMSEQIDLLSP